MRHASIGQCCAALLSLALSWCPGISAAVTAGYFEKLLIDNNLPNVGIYSITQDQSGYLWLASTNIGLMQFDGYQFRRHSVLNQSLTQLNWVPDIDALVFDQHNNLWVGSWGYGLARVHATDGSIDRFSGAPDDALASNFVQTLFKDQQQQLWVGTTSGINRYDAARGLSRVDGPDDAMPSRRIWAFAQTADGTLWIGTSAGLHSWRPDSGISAVINPQPGKTTDIRALHVIDDTLWLGTSSGLYRYQPATQHMQQISLPDGDALPTINTLTSGIDGNLLIGTFSGIYSLQPQRNQFVRRYQNQLVELEHINVRSIFIDQSQVTWVGTRESGLYYKPRQRRAFQNSNDTKLIQLQQSLTAPVLSLLAEPDQLWLGQYGQVSRYRHSQQHLQQFDLPGRINVIRRAPDQTLWVGSDNGIFRLPQGSDKFERLAQPFNQLNLPQQNARDILFTDDNKTLINLWYNGIMLLDNHSGSAQLLLSDIGKNAIGDAIQAIHVSTDYIWLASRLSGIYLLDRQSLQVQALHHSNPSPLLTPEASGQLTCLARGPGQTVAVCTEQGVLLIAQDSGKVTLLGPEQGLIADSLVGAYTDQHDTLWLLSTEGLYALSSDGSLSHFDTDDGLNSNEMMFLAIAADQRQLYVGSNAGLELVDPASLRSELPVTQQAISKITFDQGQVAAQSGLKPITDINVPAGVFRIGFHFASFDFNNPKRNAYRYKLEGYDTDWQLLQHSNIASYTNLAPGTYQLQLMASNNQRRFSGTVTKLDVEVLPYWWQRKTVQFFALLALIILIGWLVKRRMAQVHQVNSLLQQAMTEKNLRQAQLEQAVAERTTELQHSLQQQQKAYDELQQLDLLKDQFISTVSHELRTPLTAISGALDLIRSGVLDADQQKQQQLISIASSNSKRLTLLINDLLDLEKLAADKMQFNLQVQPLLAIVQRAVTENSTYSQQRQIKLQLQVAQNSSALQVRVDEHRLLQVLANLLSNAIKFSPPGAVVLVLLSQDAGNALVSISDQGPGIAVEFQPRIFQRFAQASSGNTREQGGTGLGLALSQELMHAMQGDISFQSTLGQGCTFMLTMPLQH